MKKLVVFGAGGFGTEAIWVAESMNAASPSDPPWEILGYVDDAADMEGRELYGYRVLGGASADRFPGEEIHYHCAVGRNASRETLAARLEALGWRAATLVHPSVVRARGVTLGDGCYVGAGSILSPNTRLGRHVIVNQRVSVGHDAVMEDFSQACPGVSINGQCRILRGAFLGSNASVMQGKTVGEDAVVGANSQVVRDVHPRTTVIGIPARLLAARE